MNYIDFIFLVALIVCMNFVGFAATKSTEESVIAAIESNGCTTNTLTLNKTEIRDSYEYKNL